MGEILRAMKSLKAGKAPEYGRVTSEMLKRVANGVL